MERVREGCVMPTDKRRWQPCSFGTQSQANRVAIAGCHASGGWTRDRTYHTQASRLKLAKVRLEDIEGDLSQGVRQLYRAGKDAFAERVMALMLPGCSFKVARYRGQLPRVMIAFTHRRGFQAGHACGGGGGPGWGGEGGEGGCGEGPGGFGGAQSVLPAVRHAAPPFTES